MLERIKKIIEKEGLNPSLFADKIGISRGTMNHILNGRNKASLDVTTKILESFSINSDWLLFGTGPLYKGDKAFLQPNLFDEVPVNPEPVQEKIEYRKEIEVKIPEKTVIKPEIEEIRLPQRSSKTVEKIIIYYSDNTFENLIPENR